MATVIRLKRTGAKKNPSYQLIVTDSRRAASSGKSIEILGHYHPLSSDKEAVVNKERALYWLGEGAQVSDTARDIFKKKGIL